MNMCRSIGFCQFKQNWAHKRVACQLVITMLFAWNNFPSKTAHQQQRVCHPGYGVTSLLHLCLLLTCLLRQAQLSDTARNFHSFFWHNVKFLSFIFKAGRFGSGKYWYKTCGWREWKLGKNICKSEQSSYVENLMNPGVCGLEKIKVCWKLPWTSYMERAIQINWVGFIFLSFKTLCFTWHQYETNINEKSSRWWWDYFLSTSVVHPRWQQLSRSSVGVKRRADFR